MNCNQNDNDVNMDNNSNLKDFDLMLEESN